MVRMVCRTFGEIQEIYTKGRRGGNCKGLIEGWGIVVGRCQKVKEWRRRGVKHISRVGGLDSGPG